MREHFVLVGAGSVSFSLGLYADLIRRGQPCDLALVDTNPEALAVAEGMARKMIEAAGAPIALRASVDRREVLSGATAVICTIGVGGRRAWETDVFIPRKYGIFQPVGDSVMPGGTSRALRMVPAMVAAAEDVLDLAPKALFLNYANPMSVICRAVRKATGAEMIGLCHGVNHVAAYLAGVIGCRPEPLRYTAVGMNHLTWFTELSAGGKDLMPRLRAIATEKLGGRIDHHSLATAFAEAGAVETGERSESIEDPFTWQMTHLFGAFPAVMDRHITEFFPQMFSRKRSYFGKTLGVDAFSFEGTIAHGDQSYERMQEYALSPHPLPESFFDRVAGEHEQAIEIIDGIRADTRAVYSANLPNTGQIPNLPADAVVECPAVAGRDGMLALPQPPLSSALAGTLAARFQWAETAVDAALEGSREKFIQALVLDAAVDSVQTAAALADELLAAHADHLPRFGLDTVQSEPVRAEEEAQ